MAETVTFNAESRAQVGKGAARATRRNGRVPAVIYGDSKDSLSISLDPRQLNRELSHAGFFSTLIDISLDGSQNLVLCRDIQLHAVTEAPLHADFLRVTDHTRIAVEVQVNFLNEEECPGLRASGVLNIVRHEVELNCRAGAIPAEITIDLANREIGDSIHISDIDLPNGVTPVIDDRDFTIATIAAPNVMEEVAEEEDAEEGDEAETEGDAEDEGDDSKD